jgi:hypothetical protein
MARMKARKAEENAAAAVIVVARPEDAAELLGSPLAIVCLEPGTESSVADLRTSLAQWQEGPCETDWHAERAPQPADTKITGRRFVLNGRARRELWILDTAEADLGAINRGLAHAFRHIRPTLVRTLDPDPVHTSWDDAGRPVVAECRGHRNDRAAGGVPVARCPRPANWLVPGADGRLSAYIPTASGVVRWVEKRPGASEWSGPNSSTARPSCPR